MEKSESMKDIKSIVDDDRVRYHNDLKNANIDDLVYVWDFFKEMTFWTDKLIQEKHIKELKENE